MILHTYTLIAAICLFGAGIFFWWWYRIGRATEVYAMVAFLFLAVGLEKAALAWWTNAPWVVSIPTVVAFSVFLAVMITRIYQTNRQVKRCFFPVRQTGAIKRSVLCISDIHATRAFFRGVCATNRIEYCQSGTILHGLELLIQDRDIAVVLIGMRTIESTGLSQRAVVEMVKKENPYCVVVAMTRQPNLWELFEARRAFFDDYLYLPVDPPILIGQMDRWMARVGRWRRLDYYDRRRSEGDYIDRGNLRIRRDNGTSAAVKKKEDGS